MSEEREFRERFASLRAADRTRIPAFEQVLHRAARPVGAGRRRPTGTVLGALAVALLAVVAVGTFRLAAERMPGGPSVAIPALADWRAPTDFLLDTPGRDLLRTVPSIGTPSTGIPGAGIRLDSNDPRRPDSGERPS